MNVIGGVQIVERGSHLLEGTVAHQAGDGERQGCQDFGAGRHDESALERHDFFQSPAHGAVVHSRDDHVVRVVADRARQGTARKPETAHEAQPDRAAATMSLHDGDLAQVAARVGAGLPVLHPGLGGAVSRDDLARYDLDDPNPAALRRHPEAGEAVQVDVNARREDRGSGGHVPDVIAGGRREDTAHVHRPHRHGLQIVEHQDVGSPAGRHRPEAAPVEAEPLGRVDGGHAIRRQRLEAKPDGLAHRVIDVPFGQQIGRVTIVGDEAAAALARR
jgi:hypothetical protein